MTERLKRMIADLDAEEAEISLAKKALDVRLDALHAFRRTLNGTTPMAVHPPAPATNGNGGATRRAAAPGEPSYTQRVYNALAAHPGCKNDRLAQEVYGEVTNETKHRVRSLLGQLFKQGRVRSTGERGRWEVKPKDA